MRNVDRLWAFMLNMQSRIPPAARTREDGMTGQNGRSAFWRGVLQGLAGPASMFLPDRTPLAERMDQVSVKRAWSDVGGYMWHGISEESRRGHGRGRVRTTG
ncbi:hypothetical protein GCM10011322_17460 [Salinarimonas ramus]|uniref:Uncharacterized protein n=1 Tax=Salinarimonas ramus TaxID=690164 RepID=A0A917Q8C9_9HYPH|nr:hypothetical protein GCM10011322_17460 [Salinarimonas ramus]